MKKVFLNRTKVFEKKGEQVKKERTRNNTHVFGLPCSKFSAIFFHIVQHHFGQQIKTFRNHHFRLPRTDVGLFVQHVDQFRRLVFVQLRQRHVVQTIHHRQPNFVTGGKGAKSREMSVVEYSRRGESTCEVPVVW